MSQPKIAQVVCTYPPYHGGMGRVAYEYTERLRDRGYNVHVFTSRSEPPPLDKGRAGVGSECDPDYVHRIPAILTIGNASVMPSLYRRLSGFNLIHLHYPFFGGAEPVIVRKALRHDQGLVMTYHMDAVAGGWRGVFFEAHKNFLFPWIANRVDRVLVSSKEYAEQSALQSISGIMDRVEIHPFGIDLNRFHSGKEIELAQTLGISTNVPILLFVGGLDRAHHFKGLPILFESLKQLGQIPWHLVIVGDGDMRKYFEDMVYTLKLNDRVTFASAVLDDAMPRYYRLADIHVFPSTRRAEAFGLVALEAAASGIPTIASDLPGVRSVVLDGDTGLLVKPDDSITLKDALELLLMRTDLREQLGRSARANAELKFAWEPLITQLEETYKSVLSQQSEREYSEHMNSTL